MKTLAALLGMLCVSSPLAAQSGPNDEPDLAIRAFVLVSGEQFTAKKSFEAVFGQSVELFWGGGVQIASRGGSYIDITASRFNKTGQRAFSLDGKTFPLGIPLTMRVTPIELTGGYRFHLTSRGRPQALTPYVGVGVGSYEYSEESEFSEPSENLKTRHTGYLLVGGVEYRAHPWVRVSADVQYTHVTGILGEGGLSKELGENDLGGVAARVRIIVGR